jgi:hypothetical protein
VNSMLEYYLCHVENFLGSHIFTSVSGKSWCLRLFTPGRKVYKRVNWQYSIAYNFLLSAQN